MPLNTVEDAYLSSLRLARRHYENFPVASWILPRHLRKPVAVVYAFARTADDFADEGNLTPQQRLNMLEIYADALRQAEDGTATQPLFVALRAIVTQFDIPWHYFHDLLSAFTQDVTTKRYATRADVLDYCRRSANPVGRILLHLFGHTSEQDLQQSDSICTSLQLINFLQDVAQDYDENDRIYLPLEQMQSIGIDESYIKNQVNDTAMRRLLQEEITYARNLMLSGAPLAGRLQGRIGLELRFIVAGGLSILDALERQRNDLYSRPRLGLRSVMSMCYTATLGWRRLEVTSENSLISASRR
ncbi:MAG: squalene synthase HpnC [Gammaproteobacteria bacterium]|nr:squalene synthase HpnC [Gammaproteobacteria bacterium]